MNSRFPDHVKGNEQMLDNWLIKKRPYICWLNRKFLSTETDFDKLVAYYSNPEIQTVEPAYMILSGVGKGVILAREPDSLVYKMDLDDPGRDYLIVTNFDYWWHDFREYFDPTGGKLDHPRRIAAEKVLNASN